MLPEGADLSLLSSPAPTAAAGRAPAEAGGFTKTKGRGLFLPPAADAAPASLSRAAKGFFLKLLFPRGGQDSHPPSCQQTPFTSPGWPPKPSTSPLPRSPTSGPWAASFLTWSAAPSWG